MMRRWRWGVFGVVALGVGGMGVWAGARLKDGSESGGMVVVAPAPEAQTSPQPPDPKNPPEVREAEGGGPVAPPAPVEKSVPTPLQEKSKSPDPIPASPPIDPLTKTPAATKSRDTQAPGPVALPNPVPMPAHPAAAPPSPKFPEPSQLPQAGTSPVPPPATPLPMPATSPKPPQPDFAALVPGAPPGPTPPPTPVPVSPTSTPSRALPPPPPSDVAPAKFEPTPGGTKAVLSVPPGAASVEENSKPNNIFRALPGSAEAAPATVPTNSPWTVQIKVVQGRTELEAHNGDKVHLRITCQRMQVQAPNGNIQAQGDVKLSGSDLNGSCDLLTIIWQKEDVLMEGKVHLKCPKDAQEIDLAADRLSVKLTNLKTAKVKDGKGSSEILRAWTGFLPVPKGK